MSAGKISATSSALAAKRWQTDPGIELVAPATSSTKLRFARGSQMIVAKFGIGQPVRRVEDHRFITGQGRYTDDHVPYGCLHALVLRSPHAQARALPGVQLVLIAPDVAHLGDVPCQAPIPNDDGSQGHVAHIPVLARDTVRHVGDAIAFVVAETVAAARDAL